MCAQVKDRDIVDAVMDDHQQIRTLFTEFETARPEQREDLWEMIVRTLAVHETAEEEIVHPEARRKVDGGDDIVEERLTEEGQAKAWLAELEKLGPNDPGFDEKFQRFRRSVLAHAEHEEEEELPELRASVDTQTRQRLGNLFVTAKSLAPTHAHKLATESAVGNMVLSPILGLVDRVRDAIRDAIAKPPRPG